MLQDYFMGGGVVDGARFLCSIGYPGTCSVELIELNPTASQMLGLRACATKQLKLLLISRKISYKFSLGFLFDYFNEI